MSATENGAGAETLLSEPAAIEIEEAPQVPDAGPEPSGPRGGSRVVRRLLIGVIGLAVLAGSAVTVLLVSATKAKPKAKSHLVKPAALTPARIAQLGSEQTVMVVAEGAPNSPLVQLYGGGDILDTGSGFVSNAAKGQIVTNYHVVAGAYQVEVGFSRATLVEAQIVAVNAAKDLALLQVSPALLPGLRTLRIANPPTVQVGDQAYTFGYPGGDNSDALDNKFTSTQGQVTAVGVSITVNADPLGQSNNDNADLFEPDLIKTDASINPGNSGGALVNANDELIGVNSADAPSEHVTGYAISASELASVLPSLEAGQSTAWAGFQAAPISDDLANKWGVQGLIMTSVTAGTPADQVGLSQLLGKLSNDGAFLVVTAVNGTNVTDYQSYINAMAQVQSTEHFTVDVVAVDAQNGVIPGTAATFKLTAP